MTSATLTVTRGGKTARVTVVLIVLAATIVAATPWMLEVGGSGRAVALLVCILLGVM